MSKIAVLGAGVSGLTAIKSCLEEGLEPICFEQHDQIGGVWYYTDEFRQNEGTRIYPSLITNSSKAMTCFSDFPMPKDYPPYMPYQLYQQYLIDYAKHFNLLKYIKFNVQVMKVCPTKDYDKTGQWEVHIKSKSGIVHNETFDGVLVGTGVFKKEFLPNLPGIEKFQGRILHSKTYRHPEEFKNKNTLIVGNCNSAGDLACDAAITAAQVYLSIGEGSWVFTRIAQGCIPRDFLFRRVLLTFMPEVIVNNIIRNECNSRLNHKHFGLYINKPPLSSPVMVNDDIHMKLMTGKVKVKPHIKEFTTTGVLFQDGTSLDQIDVVVFATGYRPHYEFLDSSVIADNFKDMNLYKMVWPVNLPHNTLAFIGCMSTVGAHGPVMELQARWASRVIAGKCCLPSKKIMEEEIIQRKEEVFQKYGKYRMKFSNLKYRDQLADEIGVKPKFWELFFQDPKLAFLCFFGPSFPVQYRLKGPHVWNKAREYCHNIYNETISNPKADNNISTIAKTKLLIMRILCLSAVILFVYFCI